VTALRAAPPAVITRRTHCARPRPAPGNHAAPGLPRLSFSTLCGCVSHRGVEWLAGRGLGMMTPPLSRKSSSPKDPTVVVEIRCPRSLRRPPFAQGEGRRPLLGGPHSSATLEDGSLQHLAPRNSESPSTPRLRGAPITRAHGSAIQGSRVVRKTMRGPRGWVWLLGRIEVSRPMKFLSFFFLSFLSIFLLF
jgi:hypothetical protein